MTQTAPPRRRLRLGFSRVLDRHDRAHWHHEVGVALHAIEDAAIRSEADIDWSSFRLTIEPADDQDDGTLSFLAGKHYMRASVTTTREIDPRT